MTYHKQDIYSVIFVTVYYSTFFTVGIPLCYAIKFQLKSNRGFFFLSAQYFFISEIVTQKLKHVLIHVNHLHKKSILET